MAVSVRRGIALHRQAGDLSAADAAETCCTPARTAQSATLANWSQQFGLSLQALGPAVAAMSEGFASLSLTQAMLARVASMEHASVRNSQTDAIWSQSVLLSGVEDD